MNETPESITEWANATFGPDVSPLRCAVRANLEMAELLTAVTGDASPEAIAEECADVCIVLWRLNLLLENPRRKVEPYIDLRTILQCALTANSGLSRVLDGCESGLSVIDKATVNVALGALHTLSIIAGFDLQAEINRKMQINRARQWSRDATGIGFHIKA